MKKILYIENNASIKATSFYMSAAVAAKRCGYAFHLAYNAYDMTDEAVHILAAEHEVYFHQIDFIRTPYDVRNLKAYRQVCRLIKEEDIDVIHCNTPIGGLIGRLAGKKCNIKKVIYQAHGFHFYKNAPIINWLIYYPIEKWLAHYTDIMITINQEDFKLAQKKMRLRGCSKIIYVPGVGIDLNKYTTALDFDGQEAGRQNLIEMGVPEDAFLLVSVGELNKNKNNQVIIRALARLGEENIHYILCGVGVEEENLKRIAQKNGVLRQVHFLGYRTDIISIMKHCDVFVLPSYREGLSRALMEAMACGLPCIASCIRGNKDLINHEVLLAPNDVEGFAEAIRRLKGDVEFMRKERLFNLAKIKQYDVAFVEKDLEEIYKKFC